MTPIFIVSFNRPTFLRQMIDRLFGLGQREITVIDNGSTYPPLLRYYDEETGGKFRLIRLGSNHGYTVMKELFRDRISNERYGLGRENFMYSDDDVVPIEECPPDFADKFNAVLSKYGRAAKVGFGLKYDDLPDSFRMKGNVTRVMSSYWQGHIRDEEIGIDLYSAPIDTTLALGRAGVEPGWTRYAFRTGFPYMARHLPWYIDSENLMEEHRFYMSVAGKRDTHFPHRWGLEHTLKPADVAFEELRK